MILRLATYGTFRKGMELAYYLDSIRYRGETSYVELPGIKMFVLGAAPGVKVTNDPKDKVLVELIEADMSERAIESVLHMLDKVEGVNQGLYQRESIDTPKGKAVLYTWVGDIPKNPVVVTDWMEWDAKPQEEKDQLLTEPIISIV